MIIDLIKNKNNYAWISKIDEDDIPYWYPTTGVLKYGTKYPFDCYTHNANETYTFRGYEAGVSDDYITVSNLTNLSSSGEWSVAFWYNSNNLETAGNINLLYDSEHSQSILYIISSNNKIRLKYGLTYRDTGFSLPTDGDWHSVIISYSTITGSMRSFLDGVLEPTTGTLTTGGTWSFAEDTLLLMKCTALCGKSFHNFMILPKIMDATDVSNFHAKNYSLAVGTSAKIWYKMNENTPTTSSPYTEYTRDYGDIEFGVNRNPGTPNVETIHIYDFFNPLTDDISIIIGFENSNIIDNITLDIDDNISTYTNIIMQYSMDDWVEGFEDPSDEFEHTNWYPSSPIYLNKTYTKFNPIEFKCLKMTFVNCEYLVLNSIKIEKDETIYIDKNILEPFVYEKFLNKVIQCYKDTDVKDYIDKNIKMLDGDE